MADGMRAKPEGWFPEDVRAFAPGLELDGPHRATGEVLSAFTADWVLNGLRTVRVAHSHILEVSPLRRRGRRYSRIVTLTDGRRFRVSARELHDEDECA